MSGDKNRFLYWGVGGSVFRRCGGRPSSFVICTACKDPEDDCEEQTYYTACGEEDRPLLLFMLIDRQLITENALWRKVHMDWREPKIL